MKIFVQIAAYRDPQLIPTIKDMLEKAKKPKNLRLAIARQFHPSPSSCARTAGQRCDMKAAK